MTAPQHNAQPTTAQAKATQKDKTSSSTDKTQRCWFVALGLVGGLGFVASHVSLARAAGDFLIDDYAAGDSAASASSYSVADTTFSLPATSFDASPGLEPLPDAFIDAPPAPSIAAEAFSAPVAPAPYVAPAPAYVAPAPAPVPAPVVAAPVPAVVEPAPVAVAAPPAPKPVAAPAAARPSITIEIAPTERVNPEVTAVAPPTFASVRKPVASKVVRRKNPLAGLIEASALAAPLSAYVSNQGSVRSASTLSVAEVASQTDAESQAGQTGATTLAMTESEGLAVDLAPEAIPDIYPEAAPEVAPPIVDLAPAEAAPIQPTELVPAALPEGTNLPEEYNSIFVDPTDYSVGATQAPQAAPEVFVSEQSTGCEFTVGGGQGVPNGACGTGLAPAPAPQSAPQAVPQQEYAQTPEANYYEQAPVASAPAVNVGPVSFSTSGIRFSSATTAAGREYLNRSVRPLVNLQAAEQFIFPLAIPSPITSLFGFRVHPISGDYRFHAGTDIGAAQGTPVLAAQDGKVLSADYAGGYGLMVELDHKVEDSELRSRYAHLSDILVEPGADVKKGDVVGLVGSTGNSTGPHLHLEMMQNTADGWVLVNADSLVQGSLVKLVNALNNPMQAMNFKLSDLTLNLSSLKTTPVPSQSESTVDLPSLPGQNGVSFRPAQPNAS